MSVTSTNFSGNQNTFLTPDVIAREALLILEDNIVAPQVMNTSATADFAGARVGDTVRIRRPAFFGVDDYSRGSNSGDIRIQNAVENSIDLKIEKQFDVSFEVSSKELAMSVDEFNERMLRPAMSAIAQKIDTYALTKIKGLGGFLGPSDSGAPAGLTAPNTLGEVAAIVEKMNIQRIPMTGRKFIVSPVMQSALYGITEFVRADIRGAATSPVEEASLGRFMGLDTMMSQNLPTHTVGTILSTANADVACAVQGDKTEGTSSLTIDAGSLSGTVAAGDTVSIAYADGVTRDHVITAAATAAANAVAITINPGLYGIDAAAVNGGTPVVVSDNAVATIRGVSTSIDDTTVGAAFHPDAFQLVFVPQPNPMGPGTNSATVNYKGMSLRVLQSYDHLKKRDLISVDCLVGAAAVDGRLGVRVPSVNG
jgi:hypothetical protein